MNGGQESSFGTVWHWFGLKPDEVSPLERTLLRCALGVAIFVLVWTFLDLRTYAGIDFRNRIVGARVMLAGHDPYAFYWQADMPEEWLDPVYDPKAHRLTLAPPGLLPYALLAPLPYRLARLVSFVAEWLALIASLALLSRSLGQTASAANGSLSSARLRVIFLLGGTLFVITSEIWRLHLERGQVYVFYLLALSLAIFLSRRGRVDSIGSGVALGFLGLMRPNLLLMVPALLMARQCRTVKALLVTVAIGAAATFAVLPSSSWQSYLKVGDQYYHSLQDHESMPDLPRAKSDGLAEGVNFDQALPYIESSSFARLWRILHDHLKVPMLDLARASKMVIMAIAGLLVLMTWRRYGDSRSAFALIVCLSLDSEFFLPHRWAYADVMLLAPLALLLPELLRPERMRLQALSIVLIGLLAGCVGQRFFEEQAARGPEWQNLPVYLATVLRSWLVMTGLTILAVANWLQGQKDTIGAKYLEP